MFITKKHLSRRTLLRGIGTTLALPLLDSMIPAFASEVSSAKAISRPPPKGFPEKFLVRFDVLPTTEPLVSRAD